MYFKSRMFKFIMLALTVVLLIFGFFFVKGNLPKLEYKYTQKKDFGTSIKYARLNDGDNFTNNLNVTLRVANDDIEVNYIQYAACFDNGKKTYCNDWSDYSYIGDKLGLQITSEEAWQTEISLYKGNFTIDQLQGRHYVKIRYISRTNVMGLRIKNIATRKAYIYFDTYAPKISSSLKYEWTTKNSITISYKDTAFSPSYKNSGVSSIEYSTCVSYQSNSDGTYMCNYTPNLVKVKPNSSKSFKIPVDLQNTLVNVIIKDKAGNGTTWSQVIKQDSTKPIIKVNVDILSDLKNAGSIIVNAVDNESKISSVKYVFTKNESRPSSSKFQNELETFTNAVIELPETDGKYYLWLKAEDYAGNVTYKRTDYFYVCDDDISCSKIQPNKKDYSIVLYISIAVALVACIGIVTVMSRTRKKIDVND